MQGLNSCKKKNDRNSYAAIDGGPSSPAFYHQVVQLNDLGSQGGGYQAEVADCTKYVHVMTNGTDGAQGGRDWGSKGVTIRWLGTHGTFPTRLPNYTTKTLLHTMSTAMQVPAC